MHAAVAAIAIALAATPTPTPTSPPASEVTPGVWGFGAIVFMALMVGLLLWDLMRRIRRVRYREQVAEDLDREQAEADAAGPAPAGDADPRTPAPHDDDGV